jgi:hypothetical protein
MLSNGRVESQESLLCSFRHIQPLLLIIQTRTRTPAMPICLPNAIHSGRPFDGFFLQYFSHDPRRLSIRAEQLLALFPLLLDAVVFVQKVAKQIFPVQLTNEAVLHFVP